MLGSIQRGPSYTLNTPSISLSSSIFWNFILLAAHISKLLHTSPFSLQRYLFLDNTITLHLSHHTIIHYPSFHTSLYWNFIIFVAQNTSLSHSLFFHTKSPFLESNITHNTNNLMYLLYLTFIVSDLILPYVLQTHSSQNTHTHFSYIFKHHISQYIYIYIYIFIFLTISTHLKTYQNTLPKTHYKSPFSWKAYGHQY